MGKDADERTVKLNLQPGQPVTCKVIKPGPGGFEVELDEFMVPGFLPTDQPLKDGARLVVHFVCVHDNKLLVALPKDRPKI